MTTQTLPQAAISTDLIVLTNVFAVQPEQQHLLINAISECAKNVACRKPGFVSTTILQGVDGKSVTAIIQWRSKESLDEFLMDSAAQEQIERISSIGELQSSGLSQLCMSVVPAH